MDSHSQFSNMATSENKQFGSLIAAIDEGTSSARCLIFRAETADVVASHQKTLDQKFPQEGWVEQDPMEILSVVQECIKGSIEELVRLGGSPQVSKESLLRLKNCDLFL